MLLIGVLLLVSVLPGQLVHNQLLGLSWAKQLQGCSEEAERRYPEDVLARGLWEIRCGKPVQMRMTAVSLAGSAAVVLISVGGLWLLSRREFRRTSPLRPVSEGVQEQVEEAARSLRLRCCPRTVEGVTTWEEPFTTGPPGAPVVILPASIDDKPSETVEAIIRHELAHVAAGDVRLVWLSRSVLAATLTVLTLPVLSFAWEMHRDGLDVWDALLQPLWVDYTGRSLLILAAVFAVSQMVLRSREHEADILSVSGQSRVGLTAMLSDAELTQRINAAGQGWWRAPGGFMSFWANHPSPAQRMKVLQLSHPHLRATWLDAAVIGLLGALALNEFGWLAQTVLPGTSLAPYVALAPALMAGILMALGWGTQIWQDAVRSPEISPLPASSLVALGLGTALGMVGRFDAVGSAPHWNAVIVVPPAVCIAAALSAVLARTYASAVRPDRPEAQPWGMFVAALAVNVVLFAGTLRSAYEVWFFLRVHMWPLADWAWLTFPGIHSPHGVADAIAVCFLALLVLCWSLRSALAARADTGFATELIPRFALPSVVALAVSVGTLAGRWVSRYDQSHTDFVSTLLYDRMAAAAAGLVCLLAVCSVRGRAGLGPGLWAAPLTTLLVTGVLWTIRVHDLMPGQAISHVNYFADPIAQLAVLGGLAVIPLALLPDREPAPAARVLVPCLGAFGAAVLTATVVRTDCIVIHF
ncbi:M48 family metalloprotease [Streptomyces sp. NPDC091280]|uniref:M48 family metalloprotease n=1 Tax=Streptomyces sp. NPDC091280 TaxID=3365984 RepID=UPI0037F57FA9